MAVLPRDAASESGYFPQPFSLDPLGPTIRNGLWAPGICGLLSVLSTSCLLIFIGSRFFSWRSHYKAYIGYGMSFLVSFYWIKMDAILAPTRACFAQGWLINIGDVASGLFVFFIAAHTFMCAVKGRRLDHKLFVTLIVCTWLFALTLTALGPLIYRDTYFVRAGAWCWASSRYERERLALHYIWVFSVEFGTVIIYALVLVHLRKTMSIILPVAQQTSTYAQVDRATKLMVLYPVIYIILTLPLSAGRMWSMAHGGAGLPDRYQVVAGALIASSGFVDSLLYTLTRKHMIKGASQGSSRGASHPSKAQRRDTDRKFGSRLSNNYSKNSAIVSATPESESQSWSTIGDGIKQTRTITVTGRKGAGMRQDHAEHGEAYELEDHNGVRGRPVDGGHSGSHSRSGSSEPIIPSYGLAPLHPYGRSAVYDGSRPDKGGVVVSGQPIGGGRQDMGGRSPVSPVFKEDSENDSIQSMGDKWNRI